VNGSITSATNIQTITYTAGASGTVDLTLVVTNAAGCSATNTVNVTINANPATPTITPTPASVCANSTGNSAAGPAGATTYAWSITNGSITSATNIQTITYTAGASYPVNPHPGPGLRQLHRQLRRRSRGRHNLRLVDHGRRDHLGHQHPDH